MRATIEAVAAEFGATVEAKGDGWYDVVREGVVVAEVEQFDAEAGLWVAISRPVATYEAPGASSELAEGLRWVLRGGR